MVSTIPEILTAEIAETAENRFMVLLLLCIVWSEPCELLPQKSQIVEILIYFFSLRALRTPR
jgi:hypothetical protein